MRTLQNISEFPKNTPSVITIGTFDGVHKGHQSLIKKTVLYAKEHQLCSVLLSFFPHPRQVLQKDCNLKFINSLEERSALLQKMDINYEIIHPFSLALSQYSAEEFIEEFLVTKLQIKHIIIGYDHRFGKDRQYNVSDLIKLGKLKKFTVEVINKQEIKALTISSSNIRKALLEAKIPKANQLLGYHFILTGKVIQGRSLGRTIGFPTANIAIKEDYKLIPKNGVYIVRSKILETFYYGIMNIGHNPTVIKNNTEKHIEVHFLELNQNLYNQVICLELLYYIREEQRFDTLKELQNKIQEDQNKALEWILKQN